MNKDKSIYESALAPGEYTPFPRDINPVDDELFDKKEVVLSDENGEIYSRHIVETYLIKSGKFKNRMYHLFIWVSGRAVMNYTPVDYYRLSEFIDISFRFQIFQTDFDQRKVYNEKDVYAVSSDYRLSIK